ncbi:MAG: LPXTG cell wall anchor domain-containing protein [Microbacterium sp.]|nr:MAG: LPXTG cell wall anchor domain-containing protein [Microbacterium sp.]
MNRRMVLLGASVAVLLALVSTAAHAADDVGLSPDGTTWSGSLAEPLFDADVAWVPGDSRTESFFVRNQGPSGASMRIEARSEDQDALLFDDVALRARVDGGDWVELRNGAASTRLTDEVIEQGRVVEVDVNATFDPASTNQSQTSRLTLDFAVILADAVGTDGESDADADGGADADLDADSGADLDVPSAAAGSDFEGVLPGAGATTGPWIVLGGAAGLLLGAILVRRRSEQGETS